MATTSSTFVGKSDAPSTMNESFSTGAPSDYRVFEELLDAEVLMNPAKLREAARQGIPSRFRGAVYRYLLGIASMDKSKEMTFEQMQEEDFSTLGASYTALYGDDGGVVSGGGTGGSAGTGGSSAASRRVLGSNKGGVVGSRHNRSTNTSSSSSKWNYCCHDDPLSVVGDAQRSSVGSQGGGGRLDWMGHSIQPSMHVPPLLQEVGRVPHETPWEAAFTRCRLQRDKRRGLGGPQTASSGIVMRPATSYGNSLSTSSARGGDKHGPSPLAERAVLATSGAADDEDDDASRSLRVELALRALRIKHPNASRDEVDVIFAFADVFVRTSSSITACDVFHLTEALVSIQSSYLNPMHSAQILQEYCGAFLMLFHQTNTELYHHFHTEGVLYPGDGEWWVLDYMRSLLAKQLHLDDFLRLLDTYLADCSETGGFSLHVFVCLSLLSMLTEDLMEMDKTQIVSFLQNLPRVDAEVLLQQALSVREMVLSRELL